MNLPCSASVRRATPRDLLDHKSGLPRLSTHPLFGNVTGIADAFLQIDPKRSDLNTLQHFTLDDKERRFLYSNLGYRHVTYLLEKALNRDFAHLVNERLNRRYGLASVTVATDLEHEKLARHFQFGVTKAISFSTTKEMIPVPSIAPYGDGAIIASLNDMLALSSRILDKTLFRNVATHRLVFDDANANYAFGFLRGHDQDNAPYYFHNGAYFGCTTLW